MSDQRKTPHRYTTHNYDHLNQAIDESVRRESIINDMGTERIAIIKAKALGIVRKSWIYIAIALALLIIGCGIAYSIFVSAPSAMELAKSSNSFGSQQSVETIIVKVPDPNLSTIIEVPVYIEKPVYIPITPPSSMGEIKDYVLFASNAVTLGKITRVETGIRYLTSEHSVPDRQWCHAGYDTSEASSSYVHIGNANGVNAVKWSTVTKADALLAGTTKDKFQLLRKHCKFISETDLESGEKKAPDDISEVLPANPENQKLLGTGSGFVINKDSYAVSNAHVVDSCESISWKIKDIEYYATLEFKDSDLDLSIIRIQGLVEPEFARFSERVRSGTDVLALGYPLGDALGNEVKVTKGNISALTGYKSNNSNMQFTAPIQPGNSGGPLLNMYGQIVGVNTASLTDEDVDLQNINFAVKATTLAAYLGRNRVNFEIGVASDKLEAEDIVAAATDYTGRIQCYGH